MTQKERETGIEPYTHLKSIEGKGIAALTSFFLSTNIEYGKICLGQKMLSDMSEYDIKEKQLVN